jgi:hypothetical protein
MKPASVASSHPCRRPPRLGFTGEVSGLPALSAATWKRAPSGRSLCSSGASGKPPLKKHGLSPAGHTGRKPRQRDGQIPAPRFNICWSLVCLERSHRSSLSGLLGPP